MKEGTSIHPHDQATVSAPSGSPGFDPEVRPEAIFQGLCSTCNNASFCSFRKDPNRPVLFCEEFDSSSPTIRLVPTIAKRPAADPDSRTGSNGRMGLCMNCDRSNECTFRAPEGGVWHCEEYE